MTSTAPAKKVSRQKYDPTYRDQLLLEAEETTVYGTALRHGLHPNQLFVWRKLARLTAAANNEAVKLT